MKGPNRNNIYELPSKFFNRKPLFSSLNKVVNHVHQNNNLVSWHRHLGHPFTKILSFMLQNFELDSSFSMKIFNCNSCLRNKSSKLPFKFSTISSSKPLEVIYSDMWGSPNRKSRDEFSYYVVFVNHFTRFTWLVPVRYKSKVATIFKRFKTQVEKEFDTPIQTLYSDNGGNLFLRPIFLLIMESNTFEPNHTHLSIMVFLKGNIDT